MMIQFKLKLKAGNHHRSYCPVAFRVKKSLPQVKGRSLSNVQLHEENGPSIAVQCVEEDEAYVLHWIVKSLSAHETVTYTVSAGGLDRSPYKAIQLIEDKNKLNYVIDGQLSASFVYDRMLAKPYLGPVIDPNGDSYTRLDFNTKEHPHHRSIWLGIGAVNGVDTWNEPADRYGKQIVEEIERKIAGPAFASISSKGRWTSFKGTPLLTESRTMTIYHTPAQARIIDVTLTLSANYGSVELGATKEAGPLGIRVAESMSVNNGGTMTNAHGSIGEEECWGKRAEWCDYYGTVGDQVLGIATFDHPENADFPTYWHIRNYGLMAPNNLYFQGRKLLQEGESIAYRFRIYCHEGSTAQAKVRERYEDYIRPPEVELVKE